MMYIDRPDGRISAGFFDEKSKDWQEQQKQVEARIAQLATTGLRSATGAVQIMATLSAASASFSDGQPQQQRVCAEAAVPDADRSALKRPETAARELADAIAAILARRPASTNLQEVR